MAGQIGNNEAADRGPGSGRRWPGSSARPSPSQFGFRTRTQQHQPPDRTIMAPPTPWTTRATTRNARLSAWAQSSDPTVNKPIAARTRCATEPVARLCR